MDPEQGYAFIQQPVSPHPPRKYSAHRNESNLRCNYRPSPKHKLAKPGEIPVRSADHIM